MRLKKTLNNNVAIAVDDEGREYVVTGLGIGYTPKGEIIPSERIERTFTSTEQQSQLVQLAEAIPQRYFELASEIIEYAQGALQATLADSLYLTLSDHLAYVHERLQKGLLPKNSLTWEIKQYYPREYHASERVVELLEDEWGMSLNADETASIALHIVNAEEDGATIHQSMDQIHLMDQVMQIIRYQAHLAPREDDLDYQRLVVHVRFFVQRVLGGKHAAEPSPLYQMVRESYPEAYSVAERVRSFVELKIGRVIADDEITYLIIHIARLLRNTTDKDKEDSRG